MHSYRALLINCMDPRLQGRNEVKIAQTFGLQQGEYEVLAYAGPSLWMTEPHEPQHEGNFWWLLEQVSLAVHHISEVVIVGHSSCGGFALKGASQEPEAEKAAIMDSLRKASQAIRGRFPQLGVKLVFVTIDEHTGAGLPEIHPEIVSE